VITLLAARAIIARYRREGIMRTLRLHFVAASAALSVAVAGSSTYMLIAGESGGLPFLGWTVTLFTIVYPTLIGAMRSSSRDRCSVWLRHLAAAR
jgi:hypothetical protein